MKSFSILAVVAAAGLAVAAPAVAAEPENTLYIDLKEDGCRITVDLRPDLAPKHVARIKELARKGFYDGLAFHRVIEGFMAQGGDPLGDGTGGSGQKLQAEFSQEKHVRGTASMARAQDPNSADSQFFLMLGEAPFLDGKYTIWGKISSGLDCLDKINKGNQAMNGKVDNPDHILKMQVAADAKK